MTDKKEKGDLDLDRTLVETTHKAEVFYQKNKKQINYAIIGVVVAVGLYVGFTRFYLAPLEKEAQVAAFRAQQAFAMDSFNLALNGNESFSGFETLADDYGMTKVGNLSHYYAGVCNLRMGKFEEAIDHLEDFDTDHKLLGPQAEGMIGDAYVELGNLDKGVKYYVKAAKLNKNKLTSPVFYKKAGLVYEELKEYDNAIEAYTHIKKEYRQSQEANDIDKFIARAEALKGAQ